MNEQQLRAARARMMAARGDELTRRAVETTFVIYQEDNQGRPDAWGTGVLLSIGPVRFVLSAGHVIARGKERRLSVGVPLSLAPVHGELTTLGREGTGNGDEDDIDVAAIRLDPAGWSHVDPSCFLEWHELDHSPIQVTRDSLALLGFPTTKQRHDGDAHGRRTWAEAE